MCIRDSFYSVQFNTRLSIRRTGSPEGSPAGNEIATDTKTWPESLLETSDNVPGSQNFIYSIQGIETPIVSGRDGRNALAVAIQIQEMIIQDIH